MSDAPLPSSFDSDPDFFNENRWQKLGRRLKEEPLVPVGVFLTGWALYNAQQSIRTGNSVRTNRFFRYRLYAQAFTLVAMIGSSLYYKADRLKRTEYVKLKEKQKAQEKREKWIKELEARDNEDKEWRAKMGKVKDLEKEENERQAVELMKRRMEDGSDDGRGVMEEIRRERRQKEGKKRIVGIAEPVDAVPVTPPGEKARVKLEAEPMKEEEPAKEEAKYETILGESEKGGFLGLKRIKTFYEERIAPAPKSKEEAEEQKKVEDKRESAKKD